MGLRPDELDRFDDVRDAERAIAVVVEGYCPLCRVHLVRHDEMACCPCGGCSFRVDEH